MKDLKKNQQDKGQALYVDLNKLIDEVIVAPSAPPWVGKSD